MDLQPSITSDTPVDAECAVAMAPATIRTLALETACTDQPGLLARLQVAITETVQSRGLSVVSSMARISESPMSYTPLVETRFSLTSSDAIDMDRLQSSLEQLEPDLVVSLAYA
jgi:glycine cleavage system regulatory protein